MYSVSGRFYGRGLRVSPENASIDRGLVRRLSSVSLPRGHCLTQHFVKFKQKSVEFHWVALDCDLGGQCYQAFSLILLHRELSDRRRITFTTNHKSRSRVRFDRAGLPRLPRSAAVRLVDLFTPNGKLGRTDCQGRRIAWPSVCRGL
jgi:hypothetical protein